MPIIVVTNGLPRTIRRSVAETIVSILASTDGDWNVSLTSDARNRTWDIEVNGPDMFQWARRFSGGDRDADVIAETIRAAVESSGRELTTSAKENLDDALSSLATQGIAFTRAPGHTGEREYIVDRVQLREAEIIYLHNQGALTTNGIRTYLLTRDAA